MNLIDALKTGRRIRRKSWTYNSWVGEEQLHTKSEILAEDWEVEPEECKHSFIRTVCVSGTKEAWVECSICHERLPQHTIGYEEIPEPKKPRLLAWICTKTYPSGEVVNGEINFNDKDIFPGYWTRAPWLDERDV